VGGPSAATAIALVQSGAPSRAWAGPAELKRELGLKPAGAAGGLRAVAAEPLLRGCADRFLTLRCALQTFAIGSICLVN